MTTQEPLTADRMLEISKRIEAGDMRQEDARALVENAECLSDMLSDCWLALDEIARAPNAIAVGVTAPHLARRLLRRHRAPGWT